MAYPSSAIGYCSNVHPGETIEAIQHNITRFIRPVRQQRQLAIMDTGLWISAQAAQALQEQKTLATFQQCLTQARLRLTSINGFPYGNFHQKTVKQAVYQPDWSHPDRLRYTQQLATVLAASLPAETHHGVISTVPLGYQYAWSEQKHLIAMQHIQQLTTYLHELKQTTGKHIAICFEMEPDCVLETTDALVTYFEQNIHTHISHHEHLAICYDVCHQAVMFEDAYQALQRITDANINIGKIQLSSALKVTFHNKKQELLNLLNQFCEPHYLHQVKYYNNAGMLTGSPDLSLILHEHRDNNKPLPQEWRIHFHVPLQAAHLLHPQLATTRSALLRVFDFLRDHPNITPYLEVETYTWQVLPDEIRPHSDSDLIHGIVNEIQWVTQELQQRNMIAS